MPAINWIERLIGETQLRLLRLLRRTDRTITTLADDLSLTDNAVRTHIAALGRDGLVEQVGSQRDTGGKPARLYGLTREGDELFPKAYATVLSAVVAEIARADGPAAAKELLQRVGKQVGAGAAATGSTHHRVDAAANALRTIGADIDVVRESTGWKLQGYACPLSAVSGEQPYFCALAEAIVAEASGLEATECCDRSGRPRCAFTLREAPAA